MTTIREDKLTKNNFGCCPVSGANSSNSISEQSSTDDYDFDNQINNNNNNNNNNISNNNNNNNINSNINNNFYSNNLNDSTKYSFPKRKPIDIEFNNIRYNVKQFSFNERKFDSKEILHGINGTFRSGELTAIMGPSGAGKTTLLNILAGYVATGVTGNVKINGKTRSSNSQSFRNLSAYIHQKDIIRPTLSIAESMLFAANLKLGSSLTLKAKLTLIKQILMLLGLYKHSKTRAGNLSGGQRKRLEIALELINNPPVIFLDEPTTGLDSSSCTQCISLLKRLTQDGRTIICTIHQPSALIFEMFDKLYALSKGNCIYQGLIKEVVPFLDVMGLSCPSYHNPADFLMEIAVGEYNADHPKMIAAALKYYKQNTGNYILGNDEPVITEKNDMELNAIVGQQQQQQNLSDEIFNENDEVTEYGDEAMIKDEINTKIANKNVYDDEKNEKNVSATLLMQFFLLYHRNLLNARRNYFLLLMRMLAHITIAAIFGMLYHNVGVRANTVYANYVYLYGSILLIVYTGKVSVMLSFPVEMENLTREHFNRWYSLGPYFFSIILFEIPFQMVCTCLYTSLSYYLTGNSYDDNRFIYFTIMCVLASLSAQSWGFFIGATLPVKLAVFIGPILAVLFSVFGFCQRYGDITVLFRWMWYISYFRGGFHGVTATVYGMNRGILPCPDDELYCHFSSPKIFLQEMGVADGSLLPNLCLMIGVIVTMHILTALTLWYKLNKR